ncbi:MAG: succinylglutamate desuccinylase/aspartoacylase family protein [Opitutaceae bacterium]|nr:succinylglutamate desuccinylase/aspartoacylase family protein [Opitutaceae bacterium]
MKTSPGKPFWARLAPGKHIKRLGSRPGFTAYVLRGRPGPVAVINGATHGDEYEGPTVLRELVDQLDPRRICGTLVLIPVLHEEAFLAGTRGHPVDHSNLARVFPGNPRGNHAERVADLFLRHVLRHADYYLDLHSGGVISDLLPWCGYVVTGRPEIDRVQAEMCTCFDDFWTWASHPAPGRTLSSAADECVPAIYVECRGGGDVHPDDRAALHRGLRHFLLRFRFLQGPNPRLRPTVVRIATSKDEAHLQVNHPAAAAGQFLRAVTAGTVVRRGQTLGRILPLDGSPGITVRAHHAGTVVCVLRKRSVQVGDAIATVVPLGR